MLNLPIESYKDFLFENGISEESNTDIEEEYYENIVHICIDLVLSINRNYYNFVVPRVKFFQDHKPELRTLDSVVQLINEIGNQEFCKLWNYNHVERVTILLNLCTVLKEVYHNLATSERQDELSVLKNWANTIDLKQNELIRIKGIGTASVQYLRILLGVNTVKPDVHIKKSIHQIYGKNLSNVATIRFIEKVSAETGLSCREIDRFVWNLFANKAKNDIVWEDGKWS